ncbi:MAG: ABC transporter substrate-binding protein [Lachnospiraceae bacterium]|jgi:raffinose/stachyose/melibiose transport system substrate-binding protein|nr:ABC transporter substrate-binding protein [Lachnospiraceae bacterium]
MIRKKLLTCCLAACLAASMLAGCGNAGSDGTAQNDGAGNAGSDTKAQDGVTADSQGGDGKVYFLNFKSELSSEWEETAAAFTEETGIEMKVVTAGSGTYEQTLKSELSKKEMPTLFNINGPIGYQTWKDYCMDLKGSEFYDWLVEKDMAISEGEGVYAVPYAVESYGIIYNDAIMKKYFALPDKMVEINDAKEIKNFETLKAVVEDMTAKKELLGIEGVFGSTSFAPGEDWRWQTHLANLPIYYEYRDKGVSDLQEIDFSYNQNFKNIFDLYINNSCTEPTMVGAKNVEESMAEFAAEKVAMIQNGNWGWAMIYDLDGNKVQEENVKFLPIYTGIEGEEQQGLCTGTENYICVNSKISAADQKASLEFLSWLFGSDTGKSYCNGILGMIPPFSTFSEEERPDNPLVKEMLTYMNDESLTSISWNFTSFPSQEFKNQFGSYLLEYTQGNMEWDAVVEQTKDTWKNEKSLISQ